MEERFKNIEPEKRDRIINAALAEFAQNGYEKASTNEIVKNADISRGLLYHYFKDKEELYEVLTKYAIDTFVDKINSSIDWEEPDIFERLKQITFVKIEVSRVYPKLFNFVINIFLKDNNVQTMEDAYAFYDKLGINIQELFTNVYQKGIDYSKFKDQEKIGINMNIIRWTIEKWAEEILQKSGGSFTSEDMQTFGAQIDEYINALKKAFY